MTGTQLAQNHVSALEELLARYQPGEYGRETIEQRLAEARAALDKEQA